MLKNQSVNITAFLMTKGACATAIMLSAASIQPVSADIYSWATDNGHWSDAQNWAPLGVPGNSDVANIGNLDFVHDKTVFLDQDATVSFLNISSGMGFQNEGYRFSVNAVTTVSGESSRLGISDSGAGVDFDTTILQVFGNLNLLYLNDSAINVRQFLSIGENCYIFGSGQIQFTSEGGTTFYNDGRLSQTSGYKNFLQLHGGLFDLDGPTEGGEISMTGITEASMTFVGYGLTDPFSSMMVFNANSTLVMNLVNGWSLDEAGSIHVYRSENTVWPTVISGNEFELGGNIYLYDAWDWPAKMRIEADTTITDTANIVVYHGGKLVFGDSATINGGEFEIADEGDLIFAGDTTVKGGEFTTTNASFADYLAGGSKVSFNGLTEWDGNVLINGTARQNGDATVPNALGATIDANIFDMDGVSSDTHWDIYGNLVINANTINTGNSNRFDGTIYVPGGFFPKLVINLTNPNASWTMAGEMNLSGFTHLFETRVDGSHMIVEGNLNILDDKVRIGSDLTLSGADRGANVSILGADTVLLATGITEIQGGVYISGQGTLQNGSTGEMTIMTGSIFSNVGLVNQGLLDIDNGAGEVTVTRFENTSIGTLVISLGGYTQGEEHDLLNVSGGPALLDGLLEVEIIDMGAGLFEPSVGDKFTFITAQNGVIGSFINNEVITQVDSGPTYMWGINYEAGAVVLELKHIVLGS